MLINGEIDNEPSREEEKEEADVKVDVLEGDFLMIIYEVCGKQDTSFLSKPKEKIFSILDVSFKGKYVHS